MIILWLLLCLTTTDSLASDSEEEDEFFITQSGDFILINAPDPSLSETSALFLHNPKDKESCLHCCFDFFKFLWCED